MKTLFCKYVIYTLTQEQMRGGTFESATNNKAVYILTGHNSSNEDPAYCDVA